MARDFVSSAPALDELLCFAIHAAGFAFNRVYRQALQELGLTYPQYLVMVALWGTDGVTVGGLGERLSLESSTLTPLLKRLEGLGLVTRVRSKLDERQVIVALTKAGRAMRRKAAGVTGCVVQSAGLPRADLDRLTRQIQALRSNLDRAAAIQARPRRSGMLARSGETV